VGAGIRKIDTIRQRKPKVENKAEPLLSILEPVEAPPPAEKDPKPEKKKKEKKVKQAKPEKPKKLKARHKIAGLIVFLFVFVFVLISVGGAAYAHQQMYANKVFPGVKVWGVEVGGKTMPEVQGIVTEKIKSFKVTLNSPTQDYKATSEDLGLIFNSETMALSAYSKGRTGSFWNNYITRARLLGSRINIGFSKDPITKSDLDIPPSYSVDQNVLDGYIKKLTENINIPAKDSRVKVENGTVRLEPAIYGREVDTETLKKSLLTSIEHFNSTALEVKTEQVAPKVIDNSVQEVMVQAENVMSRPVTLSYQDQKYSPDKQTVGSWLTFQKPVTAQTYQLVVDPAQMSKYFAFLRSKVNINPITKKIQVKNGVEQTVTQEGKDGLLIDETALGKQIASILPNQPSVNLDIPMYVAKYKTEYQQVLVANWDKYIDINLSTQTLTAYLKGGVYVGSWKVTTGNRYHPTPVGTWLITGKSAVTRMTGGTPGIDYYDLPNVHWVSWFKGGGYSIHEAYWRYTFGGMDYVWNGSHGCVNAPISLAKFIYDWAPVGTPVIVHN
jgi:lipoprotein-anchoring transpeptidase ErfK/SrfK